MPLFVQMKGGDELIKNLDAVSDNLTKELRIVSWKVSRYGVSQMAKEVTKTLNVPQKVVKQMTFRRRDGKTGAAIMHWKGAFIPAKDFGGREKQTARGTRVKFFRNSGSKIIPRAFMGPKPGLLNVKWRAHVFHRKNKASKEIKLLRGPSSYYTLIRRGPNAALPILMDLIDARMLK
jgi:hypothetical protein